MVDGELDLDPDFFHVKRFSSLKRWLFNDIALIFSSRQMNLLEDIKITREPSSLENGAISDIAFKVYGFEEWDTGYLAQIAAEVVKYLEALFNTKIPFEQVIFLVSDKKTKIESLGNILTLNDIEFAKIDKNPNSLIYISLTVALFFARIYFGNLVTYISYIGLTQTGGEVHRGGYPRNAISAVPDQLPGAQRRPQRIQRREGAR